MRRVLRFFGWVLLSKKEVKTINARISMIKNRARRTQTFLDSGDYYKALIENLPIVGLSGDIEIIISK